MYEHPLNVTQLFDWMYIKKKKLTMAHELVGMFNKCLILVLISGHV